MKKTLLVLIIFSLSFTIFTAFSREKYERYTLDCIENLEKYGVVELPYEKWTNTDFIKRRDVFELIFFIRFKTRDYDFFGSGSNIDEIKFQDIEQESSDEYFVHALYSSAILRGREIEGKLYAHLNEDITYYEALVSLGRLFTNHNRYDITNEILDNYPAFYPYFYYTQDLKIINSKNPTDLYCPQIKIEELNDRISAYEFLSLLNRALYVPTNPEGGYNPSLACYYINGFIFNYEQELEWRIKELETLGQREH